MKTTLYTKRDLYIRWKGKLPQTPKEKKIYSKLTIKNILSYIEREKCK